MASPNDLTATDSNIATVERFLSALRDTDLDAAADLLGENILYENVGFSRMRGSRRVMKVFAAMRRAGGTEAESG